MHYPVLITLEEANGPQAWRFDYQQKSRLEEDRWSGARQLALACSARGWLPDWQPLLLDHGGGQPQEPALVLPPGKAEKVAWDGLHSWRLEPRQGWPAPYQLVQRSFAGSPEMFSGPSQEKIVWERAGWEILDLCPEPEGPGVYFAVQPPIGERQLLHWNPLRRKSQCLLRHPDFDPLEFSLSPRGDSLVFVHQQDDQVYRLNFEGNSLHQISIPQLEMESQQGYRAYRCSPAFSPDARRIFYSTAYLEMCGLELCNWGNLYVAASQGGALRKISLDGVEEACILNVIPATGARQGATRPLTAA